MYIVTAERIFDSIDGRKSVCDRKPSISSVRLFALMGINTFRVCNMWTMMCRGLRLPTNARLKKLNTRLMTVINFPTTCARFLFVIVQYTLFNSLLVLLCNKSSVFSYEMFRKVYTTWEQAPNDFVISVFSFYQIKFGCTALTAAVVWGTRKFIKSGCERLFAAPVGVVTERVSFEFKRDFKVVEKIFSYKLNVGFLA